MNNITIFILRLPRNTETTPEAAQTFSSTLIQINSSSFLSKLTLKNYFLTLEIALVNQQIRFKLLVVTKYQLLFKLKYNPNTLL